MKNLNRIIIGIMVLVLLLALPSTVLANKRIFKAQLSYANELHEVVGSVAKGSAVITTNLDGSLHFAVSVRDLSGDVTGMHLHGPATTAENAPVLLDLCSAAGGCTVVDGMLIVSGDITSAMMAVAGVRARDLFEWLDGSLIYINVHTALNPAGEARGQFIPR